MSVKNDDVFNEDYRNQPNQEIIQCKVGQIKATLSLIISEWQRNCHEIKQEVGDTHQKYVGLQKFNDEFV